MSASVLSILTRGVSAFAAGAISMFFAVSAAAAIITFEDVTNALPNEIYTSVTSGGFSFTSTHFHIVDNPGSCALGGCVSNGTQYAAEDAPQLAGPLTMTSVGGGTFALIAFDGAELFLDDNAASNDNFQNAIFIRVVGNLSDGGEIAHNFRLDGTKDGAGGAPDFEAFLFESGWDDLTSAVWSGVDGDGGLASMAFDNINAVASVSVPEPSTVILIAVGMLGFAVWRRGQTL